jgi:hypothetical protein
MAWGAFTYLSSLGSSSILAHAVYASFHSRILAEQDILSAIYVHLLEFASTTPSFSASHTLLVIHT